MVVQIFSGLLFNYGIILLLLSISNLLTLNKIKNIMTEKQKKRKEFDKAMLLLINKFTGYEIAEFMGISAEAVLKYYTNIKSSNHEDNND